MNLTDTHCHLNFDVFDEDLDIVIENAQNAGVKKVLVPGIDIQSSIKAIELSEKYDLLYAAVGVHPNSAFIWSYDTYNIIRELSDHPKVVAIGEIGMDFYRKKASAEEQKITLEAQLALAEERKLPVIIHNREASDVLSPILIDWQQRLKSEGHMLHINPGVLHAFNANTSSLQDLIGSNYMFGLGGPVTYKNNDNLTDLVKQLPLNHLLIETDAPFLTPHPKRGKRNVPAYTSYIAQKISELKHVKLTTILDTTYQNANRLFCWGNAN